MIEIKNIHCLLTLKIFFTSRKKKQSFLWHRGNGFCQNFEKKNRGSVAISFLILTRFLKKSFWFDFFFLSNGTKKKLIEFHEF